MSKHISTMVAWILVAGLLLYIVQNAADLWSASLQLSKEPSIKEILRGIDSLFK